MLKTSVVVLIVLLTTLPASAESEWMEADVAIGRCSYLNGSEFSEKKAKQSADEKCKSELSKKCGKKGKKASISEFKAISHGTTKCTSNKMEMWESSAHCKGMCTYSSKLK